MEKYLKILVWPVALVLIAIFALWQNVGNSAIEKFELTKEGIKISYLLVAAEERDTGNSTVRQLDESETRSIMALAEKAQSFSLSGKRVLWVDDNPPNNLYEQDALRTLGIQFQSAISTSEALKLIENQTFDAVVSDFRRDRDPQSGYGLLEALRKEGNSIPYIIYSASVTPELEIEAKSKGALGETNRPARLFELIVQAVQ